ncbi:hypothetical protein [Streptomyces subrutilus]|uniref:hypothetical protein n=1 Tax=Streptomyces subrutilus TaxID=36818 RepID=UPI0033FF4C6A
MANLWNHHLARLWTTAHLLAFDPTRERAVPLSFSAGPHYCIGARLATTMAQRPCQVLADPAYGARLTGPTPSFHRTLTAPVSDRGLAGLATNRAWWFPEPPGPLTHGRTPPGEVAPGDAGAGRVEVGPGNGCVKWPVGVLSGRIRLR